MAKAFEDIGKESVEFIAKGYPNSGTFKISTETKTPNGVALKATATRSFDSKGEKIGAEVEPKFDWKQHDVELNGKLATGGEFEGGITFNEIVKGAKISFTGFQSDSNGNAVKASATYKHEMATLKAGVKFPFKDNTHVNWNGELTVRHENVYAGADIRFDQAVPAPSAAEGEQPKDRLLCNFKAGYVTPDFQVLAYAEDQVNKDKGTLAQFPILHILSFNFLCAFSNAIKFGFGASVERNNIRGVELNAGGEYKVDKDTVVKGKFSVVQAQKADDREFRLGLAAKQNITDRVNVTVGADVNARAMLGTPGTTLGNTKPHSYGFEIKFQ